MGSRSEQALRGKAPLLEVMVEIQPPCDAVHLGRGPDDPAPGSTTALRDEAAARHGREVLARAMGRPLMDADGEYAEHYRVQAHGYRA